MKNATNKTNQRITTHAMYSASDLAYLRGKGYSDEEILAFWDRDHANGQSPVEHKPIPDVLRQLQRKPDRRVPGTRFVIGQRIHCQPLGEDGHIVGYEDEGFILIIDLVAGGTAHVPTGDCKACKAR